MAKKPFRVRLPKGAAPDISIIEFPLVGAKDVNQMARRTRLLAALGSVPARQRNQLARAVAEACRLFVASGVPAVVRFGVGELRHQTLIEIGIAAVELGNATEFQPDENTLAKLKKWGGSLTKLDLSGMNGPSPALCLAQTAPELVRISQAEVAHWSELLAAANPEDAVAISERKRQQSSLASEIAALRTPPTAAARQAAADREHVETLSLVVSRATNAILVMDAGGVIQWSNDAFTSLTGYGAAEVVGQRLEALLFGPSTDAGAIRDFHQAFRNGHELTRDVMQYHRDGRTFWVECKLIPVHDDQGRISRWIVFQSDVTRRLQTEEALRAAKQAAETSSRSKSEFLANMSHEIRTPLNAILGMTELALTTEMTREQRDYLCTVQSSADTLLQLLNDVLDISKIEAGKLEIEQLDFNLAEIVRETLKAMAVKAHDKGLELAVHMPMEMPQYLHGDPTRIRQILFNLVGNAIKFTEHGEVVVDVEEQWRTEEDICLHFSVRDTGIGIPKDRLQQIFESFAQVDSSMARRFGGTGLGLTITSQLLRLMDGKIWVQSQEHKGSTFHFTIQLKLGEEPATRANVAMQTPRLDRKSALVVDDNATNRRILDEILRHWGMQPTLCDGATAALKQLEQASRRDQPFDLVLLDAMMPLVDGFQLAELIKDRPDLRCGTVMMLSSADRPNSAFRCRQLGIETYLVKPISASKLLEAILASLSSKSVTVETTHASVHGNELVDAPQPKRALRVLVVDDHQANRALAMKILECRGHHCVPASDGDEAIAAFSQDDFDALLMDVQMPGRDGFSTTRAIRQREKRQASHVPIIALTAHALSGDREKCLAAGTDAYLAKPIHARELVALVERLTGVSPETVHHAPSRPGLVRAAPFDISAALDRMGGEMDLLKEHIGYVLNDIPELMVRIRTAIKDNDGRLLEISAHRLKSLVGSYNHRQARTLAQSLEELGKNNRLDEADSQLDQLQPLIDEFTKSVKHYLEQQR